MGSTVYSEPQAALRNRHTDLPPRTLTSCWKVCAVLQGFLRACGVGRKPASGPPSARDTRILSDRAVQAANPFRIPRRVFSAYPSVPGRRYMFFLVHLFRVCQQGGNFKSSIELSTRTTDCGAVILQLYQCTGVIGSSIRGFVSS